MKDIKCGLVLLLLLGYLAGSSECQQVIPLPAEDLLTAREFGHLSPAGFSPGSKWLVFAVIDREQDANKKKTVQTLEEARITGVPQPVIGQDLWLVGTQDGGQRNLTEGKGSNWGASWSPDGHFLAFLSDRDGSGQSKFWIWDAETNELRKVADAIVRAKEIQWLPDGKSVLVTLLREGFTPAEYAQRLSLPESFESEKTRTSGSTVRVYRSHTNSQAEPAKEKSDPWSLDYAVLDLAQIEIATGKVNRIEGRRRIEHCAVSPDGTHVAFTSPKRFERPGSQQVLFDIVILSLGTGEDRILVQDARLSLGAFAITWSPDGSLLSYQLGGVEGNGDLYVVDAHGGAPRNLTNFPHQQLSTLSRPPLWDAVGQNVYFINQGAVWKAPVNQSKGSEFSRISGRRIVQILAKSDGLLWSPDDGDSIVVLTEDAEEKQSGFYRIDLTTGGSSLLLEDGRCYVCARQWESVAVSTDGRRIAYFASDAQHSNDLWLTDAGFKQSRRLTHINPQFDKYKMGAARLIQWRSLDGESLKGALLLPAGYEEGKRYPLIVSVYGGGRRSDRLGYFGLGVGVFNLQFLATRGYAVLLPDAPQEMGTPMMDLVKTVLPGVDRVIEIGVADPERLGVMGHSYGGYSALALIVHTKRFKAALMSAGFGNLLAMYGEMAEDGSAYGTSVLEKGQGLMGGAPWEFRERYIENSPIFYLNRIQTPLLIIHGGADRSIDPFLAAEVFVGLRRLGKEVEFAKYKGEGHDPLTWSNANQMDFCNRMIAWFDRHLKTRTVGKPERQVP